jgi:hypothetical protein
LNFLQKYNLYILYFIEHTVHMSIVCTPEFHNDFWQKILFIFFNNNFKRINHCKFIHHKSHFKPILSYLPCIVRREYFSIILNVQKCALYLMKYRITKDPGFAPQPGKTLKHYNLYNLSFLVCHPLKKKERVNIAILLKVT